MRKLLVTLDDDLSKKLATYPNQNEVVRKALRLYIGDISADSIEGLRVAFTLLDKQTKEIHSKIDYLTTLVQK